MPKKKRKKIRLSRAERKRRSLQAKRNFGLIKSRSSNPRRKKRRSRRRYKRKYKTKKIAKRGEYRMARRRRGRGSRGRTGISINRIMVGAGIVAVADPIVDQLIDKFAGQLGGQLGAIDIKDLIKVGGGYFLAKRRGMLKGAGYAWVVLGINNLVRGATKGIIG